MIHCHGRRARQAPAEIAGGTGERLPIREATAADILAIARLHYESWVTTYTPIVPPDVAARFSLPEREAAWAQVFAEGHGCVFVGEDDGGRIVGVAHGGPWRGDADVPCAGELYVLHVAAAMQGRGIGRALVRVVAEWLAAGGMTRMCVWVLRDNAGARRFYEALGGQVVREAEADFFGIPSPEVLYGYADTAPLRQGEANGTAKTPRHQDGKD